MSSTSKVSSTSKNVISADCNVFEIPDTRVDYDGTEIREHLPSNPTTETPIIYMVWQNQAWLNPKGCYFLITLRITKRVPGSEVYVILDATDDVATIDMPG